MKKIRLAAVGLGAALVITACGSDDSDNLKVALISFGFKNGLPMDADIVFDETGDFKDVYLYEELMEADLHAIVRI